MDLDEMIEESKWGGQARRGEAQTKYALFYHPLFFPNNSWLWKFAPGLLIGFTGCLLLFGDRLRRNREV